MRRDIDDPALPRRNDFLPRLSALWEEAERTWSDKPLRQNKKPIQRRAAARGNDIKDAWRQRFDSGIADRHGCGGEPRRLAQKGAFAGIRLDQFDAGHTEDRQYQTGK